MADNLSDASFLACLFVVGDHLVSDWLCLPKLGALGEDLDGRASDLFAMSHGSAKAVLDGNMGADELGYHSTIVLIFHRLPVK